MKNITICFALVFCSVGLLAQSSMKSSVKRIIRPVSQKYNNELAIVTVPFAYKEQSSYSLLYRRSLSNDKLMLRGGLRFLASTNKEIRFDTLAHNSGTVQFDLSIGIQRKLNISELSKVHLYVGADGYYNSEFNQKSQETYYGYYWNFGLKPLVGLTYEPYSRIRLSLESKSNFNFNFQEYSADGENSDSNISFRPTDQLTLSFGYLF